MDIKLSTQLQNYISSGQRDLFQEGFDLITHMENHGHSEFHDYSFLVFPFAKAYEGFLKQIFLDINYISEHNYQSTHFRLGKVLSPNLVEKLGPESVYNKICDGGSCSLGDEIWDTWKVGRNEIFHYFPHNLRSISMSEALNIIRQIISTMEKTLIKYHLDKIKKHPKVDVDNPR
jgi:hypothetical protein